MLRKTASRLQDGQSMVEFVVVLVFGVMVLTIGPGGDVLLDLLGVINDKYQGYSYAVSMSDMPQFDNLGAFLVSPDGANMTNPNDLINQMNNYTQFPTLDTFPDDLMPDSPADILDGATSLFF